MTLTVINGGASGPAANGSAGNGFEWHPLAELLFDALDTKDARTLEQIRARMSKPRRYVTRQQVNAVIRHVRDHAERYGWVVPFVQKGSGSLRVYWLQDGTEAIEPPHTVAFKAAAVSYVRGAVTQHRHFTTQAVMMADTDGLNRGDRRFYRRLAGDSGAVLTLMENLLASVG